MKAGEGLHLSAFCHGGQKQVTMRAQITYETGEIGVTERLLTVKEV